MSFRIRRATSGDLPALFDVWRTAVAATHDFLDPDDAREIAELVRDAYLPTAELEVAVDDQDCPQAFIGMTGNEIDSLFVHAGRRGTGIGRAMVELAQSRFDTLFTEVNEQNTQGVAFWTHVGFRQIERTAQDREGRQYPLLRMRWSRGWPAR